MEESRKESKEWETYSKGIIKKICGLFSGEEICKIMLVPQTSWNEKAVALTLTFSQNYSDVVLEHSKFCWHMQDILERMSEKGLLNHKYNDVWGLTVHEGSVIVNAVIRGMRGSAEYVRRALTSFRNYTTPWGQVLSLTDTQAEEIFLDGRRLKLFPNAIKLTLNTQYWLVANILLHTCLTPCLRLYLETQILQVYNNLKTSHNIHLQGASNYLKQHGPYRLNYKNINGNVNARNASTYDYKVVSHHDFARLFVLPFMAHFTQFDGKCDSSAILSILINVDDFRVSKPQGEAIREVRNTIAHCNMDDWNLNKLNEDTQKMVDLVNALPLFPNAAQVVRNLKDTRDAYVKFFSARVVSNDIFLQLSNDIKTMRHALQDQLDTFRTQGNEEAAIEANNIKIELESTKDVIDTCFLEFRDMGNQLKDGLSNNAAMLETVQRDIVDMKNKTARSEQQMSQKITHLDGKVDQIKRSLDDQVGLLMAANIETQERVDRTNLELTRRNEPSNLILTTQIDQTNEKLDGLIAMLTVQMNQ